jgi:hypothetical protein
MARFKIRCTGTRPLLMHNARLADPLDEVVKAMKRISAKRRKTDEDYEELARLEHAGGLYIDPDIGPFLPGQNVERCLLDAARISRAGKSIERGVFITTDVNPVAYVGPRDRDGLWGDRNFRHTALARVQSSRIARTRPVFPSWMIEADGDLDTSILSIESLSEIAVTAGSMVGLGDWRPRFGRFTAEIEQIAA